MKTFQRLFFSLGIKIHAFCKKKTMIFCKTQVCQKKTRNLVKSTCFVKKKHNLDVLFEVFGATFEKWAQQKRVHWKVKKKGVDHAQRVVLRTPILGVFSNKTCKKGALKPPLKQDCILLDSGQSRYRKEGFREVPHVSSTQ